MLLTLTSLRDSVELECGNWQELLIKICIQKGTLRDVMNVDVLEGDVLSKRMG